MEKIRIDRTLQIWFSDKFSVHILLPVLFIFAYFGNYLSLFLISWGIALLHEASHIIIGLRLGIDFSSIGLQPFGVCARLKTPIIKSPGKEIVMALAGPCCNFLVSLIAYMLYIKIPIPMLWYAITASLAMGLLNLLPCLPLDGGRILRALFTLGSDSISAWQSTARISRFIAIFLLTVAIYLLLTSIFQFSLILIGVFLIGDLCNEQKNISIQALRELLFYKEKLERNQLNRTSILIAYKDVPARKLLHKLSYHKYYIIEVIDERQNVIAHISESQILDALLTKSIRITLGEIASSYTARNF